MTAASLITKVSAQIIPQYQTPPAALATLVNAPVTPDVRLDSKGELMLILERAGQPGIAELSQPELRLAGIRLNPANNGPSRAGYYINLKIKNLRSLEETQVTGLPAQPLLSHISWSPDETKIALCHTEDDKIRVYILDISTGNVSPLPGIEVNAVYGAPFVWSQDSQSLIIKRTPSGRGEAPVLSRVPSGPTIQENIGKETMAPTYQDLLKNAQDEKLFDYYFSSELARVFLDGRAVKIADTGIFSGVAISPDGQYILTYALKKPYSYLVPAYYFPAQINIITTDGKLVKELYQKPLVENVPWNRDDVTPGRRNFSWRSDAPATLCWIEAADGGNVRNEAEIRDIAYTLEAPFTAEPVSLHSSPIRIGGITWGNSRQALVHEGWWKTRKTITKLIDPTQQTPAVTLFDRSSEDRYNAPGSPVLAKNQFGRYGLDIDKQGNLLLIGEGASEEGDRPFIDLFNLTTKTTKRLWRSEAPVFEQLYAVLNREKLLLLTSRETPEESPNFFIRNLKATKKQNPLTQITQFPHPYPEFQKVQKEILRYKRNDGVELSATLYLPAGYKKEDGPLPTFLWAYPREFKDKSSAGQVSGSPYRFNRISYQGAAAFVTRGYAVLDNAAIPIVGEGDKEPNDTYVEQLVASAKAAIDEGVRLGVTDPERVGVGGHSYGAFMTANLLTHSNLFTAGIARSGAYNRTLTPFGFQNEQRTYWKAPDIYNAMSPFMNADKMKTPLLLIHGEADNNTGTFPMQSERYYAALKGMGATTRLVILPYESHGYAARESLLHMLWEMDQWLETYVKNKKQ